MGTLGRNLSNSGSKSSLELRVKITEISFHGMPCQHIAETRHHDFGDKCWGISSISQIDDRCEYTTLLPFKGHVPVA